jgi:outer membrane protein TolC
MREQMPGFSWNKAMMERWEVMQMLPLPGRWSVESDLAGIRAEHAHHEHLEKFNDVMARLRTAFAELWYAQQAVALTLENESLLRSVNDIVRVRYASGGASQQEVLRVDVERARLKNVLAGLRRQERTARAMLGALLGRSTGDGLGSAFLADSLAPPAPVGVLLARALAARPMVRHDSLGVEESRAMRSMAGQEALPEFRVGLQYLRLPQEGMTGWSVVAGLSLPVMPWSLVRSAARREAADADIRRAEETYRATTAMVSAAVTEADARVQAAVEQWNEFRQSIVPRARQSHAAAFAGYRAGGDDFLMVLDATRMLVEVTMEGLMVRMQYEQAVADLERAVGSRTIGLRTEKEY